MTKKFQYFRIADALYMANDNAPASLAGVHIVIKICDCSFVKMSLYKQKKAHNKITFFTKKLLIQNNNTIFASQKLHAFVS